MAKVWLGGATVVVLASITTSCTVPDQRAPVAIDNSPETTTTATSTPSGAAVVVYLVGHDQQLVGEERNVNVEDVGAAVKALLRGPTAAESAAGAVTFVPANTTLLSWRAQGPTAYLNFSDTLAALSGEAQILAFAQIVETVSNLGEVSTVGISIDGQGVNAPLPNGTLAQGPVGSQDYASLEDPHSGATPA